MSRRPTFRHLVGLISFCVLLPVASGVASAQEPPPPGATDGWPVGSESPEEGATLSPAGASAASTPTRYFGRAPYQALRQAVVSTSRSCSISDAGLVALVLAPVFKESSNATSPASAPAPMTLSRFDEWTGTFSEATNRDANYGLYAFRNPNTQYSRAYWHPGIGIWQYDSAGLGAPFHAVQRMHAGTTGGDVARIVSTRYCNARASAPGADPRTWRLEAWRDWGFPCNLCDDAFGDLYNNQSDAESGFQSLQLVGGIDVLGGTAKRTCLTAGGHTLPCWYVDPANAQGANWWVTLTVDDGDPRMAPAPLSKPFYVFSLNGQEQRHWLREDTGYGIDISARRNLGHNARPRSNDSQSGLAWSNTSGLCDLTLLRGLCDPVPPSGVRLASLSVGGNNYQPLVGDFDGNGLDDIFWYAPGPESDYVWWSTGLGKFASAPVGVGGTYTPLVGDVDGDGRDDVVWYGDGAPSYVHRGSANRSFPSTRVHMEAGRVPNLVDIDGDGADEVLAYGPGSVPDEVLDWSPSGFVSRLIQVGGDYLPIVGDFDGNGSGDIVWYAAGSGPDYLWRSKSGGQITSTRVTVNGTYEPLVGDMDGDGRSDIVWYAVGSTPDYTWFGRADGRLDSVTTSVGGAYTPIVADLAGDGRDDVVWYAPGSTRDYWWRFTVGRALSSTGLRIDGDYVPKAGRFGLGGDGVLWYGPGTAADALWFS